MITTLVGRTFLKAFNEARGTQLSAKQFFEKHYFKLFFEHPKYMQWITNSPFVQMKAGQKPHLLSATQRRQKLADLRQKIATRIPEASIAIGYPAADKKEYAITSGQVSDLPIPTDEESIYLSWIGSGLGLTVAGGYSILFDDPTILLDIYKGWTRYRKYLNDPTMAVMKGNQVNTWNAQWLAYYYDKENYRNGFNFARVQQRMFKASTDSIEVKTIAWSRLFFRIAAQCPNKSMVGHIYSHGDTNKTIGFIPFHFKSGNRLVEVYRKLFDPGIRINATDFENLFGLHIKRACELGTIGIQALRPGRLKKYYYEKNPSFNKPDEISLYHVFKTWLVTMLSKNKEELLDHTSIIAKKLIHYRKGSDKTGRKILVEETLIVARQQRMFLDGMSEVIKTVAEEDRHYFKKLRDEAYLMTPEEYGYFVTLLRFDYYFLDRDA